MTLRGAYNLKRFFSPLSPSIHLFFYLKNFLKEQWHAHTVCSRQHNSAGGLFKYLQRTNNNSEDRREELTLA
jgi:hypothetical protein